MGWKGTSISSPQLQYKGQGPMLTYVLHRIAGVGLFTFFIT